MHAALQPALRPEQRKKFIELQMVQHLCKFSGVQRTNILSSTPSSARINCRPSLVVVQGAPTTSWFNAWTCFGRTVARALHTHTVLHLNIYRLCFN